MNEWRRNKKRRRRTEKWAGISVYVQFHFEFNHVLRLFIPFFIHPLFHQKIRKRTNVTQRETNKGKKERILSLTKRKLLTCRDQSERIFFFKHFLMFNRKIVLYLYLTLKCKINIYKHESSTHIRSRAEFEEKKEKRTKFGMRNLSVSNVPNIYSTLYYLPRFYFLLNCFLRVFFSSPFEYQTHTNTDRQTETTFRLVWFVLFCYLQTLFVHLLYLFYSINPFP